MGRHRGVEESLRRPAGAAAIERLARRLRWRRPIPGSSPGMGVSSLRSGTGEFVGHMRWQTGDDIARLDLPIYRRLRQRWTRKFRDDAAEPLTILIERSPSMAFGNRTRAVEEIVELLVLMAQLRHDPVRLFHLEGETSKLVNISNTNGSAEDTDLSHWSPRPSLATIRRGTGGRVVIISARLLFVEPQTELAPLLSLGEVLWLAPLLADEISPSFTGAVELQGAGGDTPWIGNIDAAMVARYVEERRAAELRLEGWLRLHGGNRVRLSADLEGLALLAPLMARGGPLEVGT